MSIDPSSAKYLIKAKIKVDGAVEKSDVIGAIFGQTEGLIGDDLDLRDLQKSARIGRIEVDMHQKNGKSEGTLSLTSALEKVETAIIAAGIESVDRIGPCKAEITIDKVEDVRISKRKHVVDRAKEILTSMIKEGREEIEDIAEIIRQSVQVEEIEYYGKEHLPAGPNVAKSDAIIVVEGRNDVVNLLKHGIKNAISVEGTSIPKTVVDLCTEKIATAFVDGDRGGDLILKELLQVADIDFVARAPKTREVEELPYKLIMKALKNKIPTEQYMEMHGMERDNSKVNKKKGANENVPSPKLNNRQKGYKKLLSEVNGKHMAVLLDSNGKEMGRVKVDSLIDAISKNKPDAVVFDGITTQRLVDNAFEHGVTKIISTKRGELSKVPSSITIITDDELR
ncbi:MAG: DNA primase [Thermoplasmata archaeon]|nr:MAG: DNA primase [Thermoplasmata archaeon]RLF64579.1 MAG: DNA primase [Thermoplasmata archaeon]